jgi:hypothetical protein
MKKNSPIAIALLIIACVAFYWYEWKPSEIRKACSNRAIETMNQDNAGRGYVPVAERADRNHTDFNSYYARCIKEKGLSN